jgi:hypothetical protein
MNATISDQGNQELTADSLKAADLTSYVAAPEVSKG